MEAVSAVATVVQLADFAGSVLQTSTRFLTAVAGASKELDSLHRKARQIEAVLENTRVVACAFQNSSLGLVTENQRTFELVGEALTSCSIDLRELQDVLPRLLDSNGNSWVRTKRRVQFVVDSDRLSRLSLRLDGHIAFIGGLLSTLQLSNDVSVQKSVDDIASIINVLPAAAHDLALFTKESRNAFVRMDHKFRSLSLDVKNVDQTIASAAAIVDSRIRNLQTMAESLTLVDTTGEKAAVVPKTNCDLFLRTLDLLGPISRKAFSELNRAEQVPFSEEALSWVMSELCNLLAVVHAAAGEAHRSNLENIAFKTPQRFSDVSIPRRFRVDSCIKVPQVQLSDSSEVLTSVCSAVDGDCKKRPMTSQYQYRDHSGTLFFTIDTAPFDATPSSKLLQVSHAFLRVSFCFVPTGNELPGVAIASCTSRLEKCCSIITAFDVLPDAAPILNDVRSGDMGRASVLKRLRKGEAWAGDRDSNGRSLLSYAVESGSRDMVNLLGRMGADPQDVRTARELEFARIRSQLAAS